MEIIRHVPDNTLEFSMYMCRAHHLLPDGVRQQRTATIDRIMERQLGDVANPGALLLTRMAQAKTLAILIPDVMVDGQLRHRAINSCIRLAHSVDGMAVWTAEDIASGESGELHPAQEAMVQCHGSQCGFCTPGFVMSLFGMYQNTQGGQGIDRAQAQADLSGNLCRCTGYRPILDAAQQMGSLPLPAGCAVNEAATVAALQALNKNKEGTTASLRTSTSCTPYFYHKFFGRCRDNNGCIIYIMTHELIELLCLGPHGVTI